MHEIILTDEQAEIARSADGPIRVRDAQGRICGYLTAWDFSPEEIEAAKRALASDQPRLTTKQVLEHLRSLEQP